MDDLIKTIEEVVNYLNGDQQHEFLEQFYKEMADMYIKTQNYECAKIALHKQVGCIEQ